MRRALLIGCSLVTALATSGVPQTGFGQSAPPTAAYEAALEVRELASGSMLRLRVLYDPDHVAVPASAGHLLLVRVDNALGDRTFFVPTDLALELGQAQVYRAEFEQASDLFGQAFGGRMRAGDTQAGFIMAPPPVSLDEYFPGRADSVVVRYAHHRAAFRPISEEERAAWRDAFPAPVLRAGLNAWWEWLSTVDSAPEMSEGEAVFFAERLFPGQGSVLAREGLTATALRNAILRVGERRLLQGPVTQRVSPVYPAAARQAGAQGLVVVLAYVSSEGTVQDALVLASNTVHLLNVSALGAALDWRFASVRLPGGEATDGWRLLPFQFRLEGNVGTSPNFASRGGGTGSGPPRILKRVEPEYPEKAYRSRIEGTVVYRVTISKEGKLTRAVLETGVHPLLDNAALSAVERMLYSPGIRDGVPVEGELLIPFPFGSKKKK